MIKKLVGYQIHEGAPRMVPARAERAWMDATRLRYAYRCLPLTIANSMGWELLCPSTLSAEWNGGPELDDIVIAAEEPELVGQFAQSHFGHGVLTFQTGYLFRTEPSVALWVRGVPNLPKDGIAPLEGIVETDWLAFTFTMNWMFTRPGRVTFERDEPFCFVTPMDYHSLDAVVPEILPIEADQELAAAYEEYGARRIGFNAKLAENDPDTIKVGWQKWYMRGEHPDGTLGNPAHISKLRVAAPHLAGSESGGSEAPRPVTRKRRPAAPGSPRRKPGEHKKPD